MLATFHLLDMAIALIWHLCNLFPSATDAFYQMTTLAVHIIDILARVLATKHPILARRPSCIRVQITFLL
jgi:hypothetical protein